MSGSHKEFPKKAVFIQLGLAALVGLGYLITDKPAAVHVMAGKLTKPVVAAAEKALAPIGKVEVKAETTGSVAKSGEEIYKETCGTCHNTGIANAPKLDNKGEWESRLTNGFPALVASAIKGKGGMPARGGNPNYSDSEIKLVVTHMVKQAGIDLVPRSVGKNASPAKTEKAIKQPLATEIKIVEANQNKEVMEESANKVEEVKAEIEETVDAVKTEVTEKAEEVKTEAVAAIASTTAAAKAAVDQVKGEAVYKSSCFACHNTGVAGAPKIGDKAAWQARIATGADALYQSAIKGKNAMPAKGGNTSISDADIKAAVDYMAAQSM